MHCRMISRNGFTALELIRVWRAQEGPTASPPTSAGRSSGEGAAGAAGVEGLVVLTNGDARGFQPSVGTTQLLSITSPNTDTCFAAG